MIKNLAILVICGMVFSSAMGQIVQVGSCPDITLPIQVEWPDLMGSWHEQQRYPFLPETGSKCNIEHLTMASDGSIEVNHFFTNKWTGDNNTLDGYAYVVGPNQIRAFFPTTPLPQDGVPFWVLNTDYTSYVIFFSCYRLSLLTNARVVFVKSRERVPPTDLYERARLVLKQYDINPNLLINSDQSNCD